MDFDELLVLIDLPPRVLGTEYIFKDLIISYIVLPYLILSNQII